jgi:hypothetical protein
MSLICISFTQFKALNCPIASPISASRIDSMHLFLAFTNLPWASHIHIPMPTLMQIGEKKASMLHLYRPRLGFSQFTFWGTDCGLLMWDRTYCAWRQLVNKCWARSHMVWFESVILSHTSLFRRFQMFHTITLNNSCCSLSSLCRMENKLSVMLLLMFRPALILSHNAC